MYGISCGELHNININNIHMETPRAQGPGRSGPRRRTGCLTCRSRKVRCDEAKPTCANCTRLRLQCVYKSVIIPGIRARSARPRSTSSTTQENDLPESPRINQQTRQRAVPPAGDGQPNFNIPFDMLGFISDMTSDFQQKHLDLTNGNTMPGRMAEVDRGFFHSEQQMTWGSNEAQRRHDSVPETDFRSSSGEEAWEIQLLKHFRESDPPPTIFAPVDLEWEYVKEAIVSEAESDGGNTLLSAVYCYSDIHKSWADAAPWKLGPSYHAQASSEIQNCLLGDMSERLLKRAFFSVLLLMLAELISRENWRPPTSYLHTSYLLLGRFRSRIESWTGLSHIIASWISLLDIKALVAGRDGDPLAKFGTLTSSTHSPCSACRDQDDLGRAAPLLSSPTYLITHSIISPAFTFFLGTQQLIRRIVEIDLHHRARGTVSDEFEVLQIAHTISGDPETLWNRRPRILDLHLLSSTSSSGDSIDDFLAPPLAAAVIRTFRSYVASFLALFVYLHRVAFAIYPRTDKVYRAVDQIIHLAKEESSQRLSPAPTTRSAPGSVPISFVWPLFIAALEGSIEQREWIVAEMQRIAALPPGHGHPNARKALILLEEMMRRQDASRMWADSRCVRQELFADFFVMI